MKDQENLEFSVIDGFDAFVQLESDWNTLWSNASDAYVSQSFTWCELSWKKVASKRGRRLFCIVGRHEGKVVLIWPMKLSSHFGLTAVSTLGPEGSEYSLVLCAPGPNEISWVQSALEFACHRSGADIIRLNCTRLESSLGKSLPTLKGVQFRVLDRTSWISWEGAGDWQAYLAGIMKPKHLQDHKRRRRNLVKQGEYHFELVEGSEKSLETVDWLLNCKDQWMEAKGKTNAWLLSPDYVDFLKSYVALSEDGSGLRLFRLTIGSKIVAATLAAMAPARIEPLIKTYDPAWSKYSPGQQLDEDMIHWAFSRGMICDFRFGDEGYKTIWCNRFGSLASVTVALTLKGAPLVALLHLRERWRSLKGVLRRMHRGLAKPAGSAPAA